MSSPFDPSFIGWKSEDGNLEVVGLKEVTDKRVAKYFVKCSKCSIDTELYEDYFISTKIALKQGKHPCNCSNKFLHTKKQWKVITKRKQPNIVWDSTHKEDEILKSNCKVACKCLDCKYKWDKTLISFSKTGCPFCAGSIVEPLAKIGQMVKICNRSGARLVSFNGLKNVDFVNIQCNTHGIFNIKISYFLSKIRKFACPECSKVNTGLVKRLPVDNCHKEMVEICEKLDYKPIGFVDGYKNNYSKFAYECSKHGIQSSSYSHLKNFHGCYWCGVEARNIKNKLPEDEVIKRCKDACSDLGYEFVGLKEEYRNFLSRVIIKCPKHGDIVKTYQDLYIGRYGCIYCGRERSAIKRKENFNNLQDTFGLFKERKAEIDYLYVIKINDLIKVGRSFNVEERIKQLRRHFKTTNISSISVWTDIHEEVLKTEQFIHSKLISWGYWEFPEDCFSYETFNAECLNLVLALLDKSMLNYHS